MTLSIFVPELLIHVLELAYYEPFKLHDDQTMLACSLVCTAWSAEAQRLLFHSVDLTKPVMGVKPYLRAALFIAASDPATERGRTLGGYVRTLHVNILDMTGPGAYIDALAPFTHLLSCCPRLYELALDATGVHAFSPAMLCALQNTGPKALRALRIIHCGVQSVILFQLLDIWPTIQFLRLGSEIVASPPQSLPKFQIYELTLGRTLRPEVLNWILSASQDTLQILEYRDLPGGSLNVILSQYGSNLRSLRLLRYTAQTEVAMQFCTRLEEIVLLQVSTFTRGYKENPFPRTLKHFSFRVTRDISSYRMGVLKKIIMDLPHLQVVTCNILNDHPEFLGLQEACRVKGVDLQYHGSVYRRFDDPVMTSSFPRRKSVSNLHQMNSHINQT